MAEQARDFAASWLITALAVSLLAHLSLLLWLGGKPRSQALTTSSLEITLQRPAQDLAEIPGEPDPDLQATPERPVRDMEAPSQPEPALSYIDEQAAEPATVEDPSDPVTVSTQPGSISILESIRENESRIRPRRRDHAALPRLPDAPGWINDFVGTVSGQSDQWVNADGSSQARIVTSQGQIYCGRNDAPPTADFFNPQFSLNVMRWRHCGRERPEPVDRSDPWLRVPR